MYFSFSLSSYQRAFCTVVTILLSSILMTNQAHGKCENAEIIGPRLISEFCWDCLYPIKVASVDISGRGNEPSGATSQVLCTCDSGVGPQAGIVTAMWEPARFIEFQRTPGCLSAINGADVGLADATFLGTAGNGDKDGGDSSFYHYRIYSAPLLQMLELFSKRGCSKDGFTDLDVMFISEVDPTWNDSTIGFFAYPETALVANPVAVASCAAESITASNPIKPTTIDSMYWCAGTWGTIYPPVGIQNGGKGVIKDTALLSARLLTALHRRGQEWRTMGSDALCKGKVSPIMSKNQYKMTMTYPVAHTQEAFVIGENPLFWGAGKIIPGAAQTPIYTLWRWNECCNN